MIMNKIQKDREERDSLIDCIFNYKFNEDILDCETKKTLKEIYKLESIKHEEIRKLLEKEIKSKEERRRILDLLFDYKDVIRDEGFYQYKRYYEVGFSMGVKLMSECFKN